jgi:hypothetical protein
MQLGSPCQLAEVEFRVVASHISTRDLVQEYLANKTFPTSSGWGMPKKKEGGKNMNLFDFPSFKFRKKFKEPFSEWLEMVETMCNEILGNYTKKEDQLMTAAFGTRPKRRLNRLMDALNFEYPDYDRLDEGAGGEKKDGCEYSGQASHPIRQRRPRNFEEDENSAVAEGISS